MVGVYKMAIAALTTLLMFFGSRYISAVEQNTQQANSSIYELAQRTTTLEESKRNTERMLKDIQDSILRVESLVTSRQR